MLAIGNDHAALELRQAILQYLDDRGIAYQDFGTTPGHAVDYPAIAKQVAAEVASGRCECGILLCGTGIGISIAANKVPGIRAALCGDCYSARMSRQHNDANILCLGGRVTGVGPALDIVEAFLSTGFEGGRHQRRVDQITDLEQARP